MKIPLFIPTLLFATLSHAPAQNQVTPVDSSQPLPVTNDPRAKVAEVPVQSPDGATRVRAVSQDTLNVLRDIRSIAPEREAEIQAALRMESEAEANLVLDTILARAKDDVRTGKAGRLALVEVSRTERDRDESVAYIQRRLRGNVALEAAPPSFRSRVIVEPATTTPVVTTPPLRFYGPGRRVITYRNREEIPPVLLASGRLKRVEISEVGGSPFRGDLVLTDDQPAAYIAPEAYAVSYLVNPETEITRNDILFEQGTTNFLDAYSYDLVADLATALLDPDLGGEAFIIEGHASTEGDYTTNLALSQARAERIARELVNFGVNRAQLVPVGYGESEAAHPAAAPESLRAQDRRVTVFTLQQ